MSPRPAATGLSHGHRALPEHAAAAVRLAMRRAGVNRANAVVLFLTPEYAADPMPALRAAARESHCLQVIGATGAGILTEQEWVLDSPGAAAMIFTGPMRLRPPVGTDLADETTVLSLCTPAGLGAGWLDVTAHRLGGVSGDVQGQGPFQVWSAGRVNEDGRAEAVIEGARAAIHVSQGVRALTSPIEVAEAHDVEVRSLGGYPALSVLVQSLPASVRAMERIPLHLILGGVTFGDPATAIRDGRYRINPIVAANPRDQSIILAQPLTRGERLFWAMRDVLAAERDMRVTAERAAEELGEAPDFALLFPCLGRGPQFYGNRDRDLDLLRGRFPGLPIVGMYGNGELGPLDGINHLYQYSTVLGLFKALQH